jgi:integrase
VVRAVKKTDPLWVGIHTHGRGWRANVRLGREKRVYRHFPKSATPREMQRWRADTKALLTVTRKERATMGSFEFDARKYLALETVRQMPTYAQRRRDIELWTAEFGRRQRDTITAAEIRGIKTRWATTPRAPGRPPLSAGTINKRLRSLSNLYALLDGARADNPVRDVPEEREPEPLARALPADAIAAILGALPDAGQPVKGQPRTPVSKAKIRLRCLAYCPITTKQLAQLRPADVNLETGMIRLPARAKGRGAAAVWQPLLPAARAAFADFHREGLYGGFSLRTVRRAFQAAARRAGFPHARIYDFRHSFGTAVYEATGSLEAVARLLQHADPRTSATYATGGHARVIAADIARVAPGYGTTSVKQGETLLDFSNPMTGVRVPIPTHRKGGPGKRQRGITEGKREK